MELYVSVRHSDVFHTRTIPRIVSVKRPYNCRFMSRRQAGRCQKQLVFVLCHLFSCCVICFHVVHLFSCCASVFMLCICFRVVPSVFVLCQLCFCCAGFFLKSGSGRRWFFDVSGVCYIWRWGGKCAIIVFDETKRKVSVFEGGIYG